MGTQIRKPPSPRSASSSDADLAHALQRLEIAQQQLAAMESHVESLHAMATLGTLAGMIAHEFNNVLTPVVSYAQMALAAPDDRELALKALHRALESTEQATRIAGSILGFARAAGASIEPNAGITVPRGTPAASANVASCLSKAMECLGHHPSKDGIEVLINCDPDLNAAIGADELVHVLINILLNARAAIQRGRGRIRVDVNSSSTTPTASAGEVDSRDVDSARQEPAALPTGKWVTISIADDGVGMSRDQIMRLFTPFAQCAAGFAVERTAHAHRPTRTGTGLGTAIVKRLVESAGGWLMVTSTPGRGTAIRIVLATS